MGGGRPLGGWGGGVIGERRGEWSVTADQVYPAEQMTS